MSKEEVNNLIDDLDGLFSEFSARLLSLKPRFDSLESEDLTPVHKARLRLIMAKFGEATSAPERSVDEMLEDLEDWHG